MNPVTRKEKPAGTFETGSLLDESMEDRERDNYEDVIAALEEAARLDPTDPAVHYELGLCYGGACGKHSLYNPELALKHLRAALKQNDALAAPVLQARILSALGNAYIAASPRHSASRLLAAIKCHRRAGAIYLQHHMMEDWAREQFNEANDWCELPGEDYPEKWNEAVALYKKSLQVRTKQNDPEHYAATMQNLGTAYRELPSGDRASNARKAITCYHEALRVRTSAQAPLKYAALQNNLGNAYLTLAETENENGARRALRSLRHFDRALRFVNPEKHPCDYAGTQFNRGQAYLLLASRGSVADLGSAASCFAEAEAHFALCGQHEYSEMAKKRLEQMRLLVC